MQQQQCQKLVCNNVKCLYRAISHVDILHFQMLHTPEVIQAAKWKYCGAFKLN